MEQPIPYILTLAKGCEYYAAVKIGSHEALQGGDINQTWARLIYMERMAVQNRYNLNPSDPTLRATANYLFSILRYVAPVSTIISNLTGSKAIIAGPSNESTTVGGSATFTVSVTSATPVAIQWLLNGVIIPGAFGLTYTVSNAQLSQSGNLYSVTATNLAGVVTSNQATLTVTAALLAQTWFGTSDPGPNLQAQIDNLTYQISTNITHNQPISIAIPLAATPNMFFVTKVPIGESVKTVWFNTALNNGNIPDSVYQTILQFGGFTYYYTRTAVSLDSTQPLVLT